MRDFRPFLQIVHGWGTRAASPGMQGFRAVRALARAARVAGRNALASQLDAGVGHDAFAVLALRELLERVAVGDPLWRRLPTWFVDAGDRSLLGDRESLALGEEIHREFLIASNARASVSLAGPRDRWPGAPPVLRPADAARHHAWSAIHAFPTRWPAPPLVERAPSGRLEVQLFALETTDTDPAAALEGRGRVDAEDAQRLGVLADQARRGEEIRALRIAVAHHRLDESTPGGAAARAMLAGATGAGLRPMAHLVLHGAASNAVPGVGELESVERSGPPYALSVGPLAGFDTTGTRGAQPQQCQLLRCYYSTGRPHSVLIERFVAARAGGVGPFRFIPRPGDGEIAEELVISL